MRPDALTVSEGLRVMFHRHVAKMLYLAKRARPVVGQMEKGGREEVGLVTGV